MKNKNKIEELEKKILTKQKDVLADTLDPIIAWFEEMKKSFSSIFLSSDGTNRITYSMEKFENKWIKTK